MRVFIVEVVLASVNHRQFPKCREVHHLVNYALAKSAFAKEAHCHLMLARMFGGKRSTRRNTRASRDDCVCAKISRCRIGNVHRSALAFAISRFFSQQFREHAVW